MNAINHAFTEHLPSTMTKSDFVEVFGGVYEHSPWIAEHVWSDRLTADHDTVDGLHAAMAALVNAADKQAKLELLCAHPDLAGKLALGGGLTAESTGEQASAGLDQCSSEEFSEFQSLNEHYKSKFGFPFILAVRGRGRAEILEAFRARVENDVEREFNEALEQVHRIAHLRLNQIN